MNTGVYGIRNKVNGRVYVGSASKSLSDRRKQHWTALRAGRHRNPKLQSSWNKHGEDAFEWVVLLRCKPADCIRNEQRFIDKLKSASRKHGFNLCPTAGSTLGKKHSKKSRAAMTAAHKRRWAKAGEEARKKVGKQFAALWADEGHRKRVAGKIAERWKSKAFRRRYRDRIRRKYAEEPEHLQRVIDSAHKGRKVRWDAHWKRKAARTEGWQQRETRTCWRCKLEKPLVEFVKSRTGTDGYGSTCKQCKRDIHNERKYQGKMKRCKECGVRKRLMDFWRCSLQKDEHGNRCKTCCSGMEAKGVRVCKRCLEPKPIASFSKLKRRGGTIDSWCKTCRVQIVTDLNKVRRSMEASTGD